MSIVETVYLAVLPLGLVPMKIIHCVSITLKDFIAENSLIMGRSLDQDI